MLKLLSIALATAVVTPQVMAQKGGGVVRSEVPGQIVVCIQSGDEPVDVVASSREWNLEAVDGSYQLGAARPLMRWRHPGDSFVTNVVVLEFSAKGGTEALLARLQSQPNVLWAAPNYAYSGDVMDLVPNDPQYGSQYHHPLMQNNLAWDTTTGSSSIIIAVTDNGIDMAHQDLAANIWVNPGEIPSNNIDDDGDGFIDDVNGWDFASSNNNPSPNTASENHGTHVAGIAAARVNNAVGVAGVAGGCRIMNVQFYSNTVTWTSTIVAAAYTYATDHGAKIVSTSYNVDQFVGDPTAVAGYQYMYDHGVLHLNSAGNNNELNPARQAFGQTLLVASTDSGDIKSSFSNYGRGVDISAPGTNILSTLPGNTYGQLSGTSMATPNAAGVAGLIWSAHPTWTRDQVAAQLVATANNINALNPTYANLLGGGRANSFQGATAASIPAPRVLDTLNIPANGGSVANLNTGFRIRFNQVLAPSTVNVPGAFALTYAGPDGAFGNGDDASVALIASTYMIGSNEVSFTIPGGALTCGRYRISANGSIIQNPFGTNLDGDGNGTGGDSWTSQFTMEPCAGDVTCDAAVNVSDLLSVITAWGNSPGGRNDINGDGVVNVADLLAVITAWGICPPSVINNDNCASPANVGVGSFAFDTIGATNVGPTPVTCTSNFGSDVWVRFMPPTSGTATVDTCTGTTFDSYLLAYSGTCASLTQIACNDDSCGSGGTRARISFPVTSGQAVLIRLGGWNSTQGTGTLVISVQ